MCTWTGLPVKKSWHKFVPAVCVNAGCVTVGLIASVLCSITTSFWSMSGCLLYIYSMRITGNVGPSKPNKWVLVYICLVFGTLSVLT